MTAKGLPLHRNKIQDKHFREQNLSLNIKIIFRVRCMKCNVYVYYNVCNVYYTCWVKKGWSVLCELIIYYKRKLLL